MKHRDESAQHGAESNRTKAEHECGPTIWCPRCNPVGYAAECARHRGLGLMLGYIVKSEGE